jgi:hypothetical protein
MISPRIELRSAVSMYLLSKEKPVAPAAPSTRLVALVATVAAAIAALALGATGATAGTTCPGTVVYPFSQWGDTSPYILAPGGNFEGSTGWTFTGGATIVSGNEPFFVGRKKDKKSLSLPAGASATTPKICVSLFAPTIRFFTVGGSSTSALKVDVIATLPNGSVVTQQIATIGASPAWSPTPTVYFFANLLSLVSPDGTTSVQFRFSPTGSTGWQMDDFYVDPRKGN